MRRVARVVLSAAFGTYSSGVWLLSSVTVSITGWLLVTSIGLILVYNLIRELAELHELHEVYGKEGKAKAQGYARRR